MIYSQQILIFVLWKLFDFKTVKELREKVYMSQKNLAYSADLERSYIASVESGQRNVSIVNIEKIIKALNITIKEFL